MRVFKHIIQLYMLAVGLRRYGAIRTLDTITEVPSWAPRLLRAVTFYIPHKSGLPKDNGKRLALALATMGPAYIKLGQTLATRPDLISLPLAEGLSTLQDSLPAFSFKYVKATIEAELGGDITDHFETFEPEAIAAASIAQVHKATTKAGTPVAVKVLRPDIEERFTRDLSLFDWLATLAEKHSTQAQRLKLVEVVAKVRETSLREMDLRLEAASAAELADNMAGETHYRLPAVHWDHTTRSLLTTEWVNGIRLTDKTALMKSGHNLPLLGETIVQTFLKQALWDGYFHADLHQGNLLVEPNGCIVAVDFGIMGRLTKLERRFLAEILFGFIRRDYKRVAQIHFDAGYVPQTESLEDFTQALRSIADPIMDLPVAEISAGKLLTQLFATTERFNMQTQPQLLLLQRTMVMAEGMALHLNPQANMWTINGPVIEQWIRENLSPEIRLAETINQIPSLIERLPTLIDRWSAPPKQAQATSPIPHSTPSKSWPFMMGLITGAIVLKIFLL